MSQLDFAAKFMDPGDVFRIYDFNKKMAQMQVEGQNAVLQNPYIKNDMQMEAGQSMEDAAKNAGNALLDFARKVWKTGGRVDGVVNGSG